MNPLPGVEVFYCLNNIAISLITLCDIQLKVYFFFNTIFFSLNLSTCACSEAYFTYMDLY